MRNKKELQILYVLIFPILFFYSGCRTSTSEYNENDSGINISLYSMEHTLVDSLAFSDLKVVFLETNRYSLHKRVDKMFVDENKIFIFDRSLSKVIVYDSNGKYLSNLHNIGKGPTEYKSLNDVFVDTKNKRIHLLCDYPFKILTYDYNMQFVKETKIDNKLHLEFVADDNYFFCRQAETTNNEPNDFYLNIINMDKQEVVESLLPIHADLARLNKSKIPGSMITKSSSILMSTLESNVIYEVNDTIVKRKYTVNFTDDSSSNDYEQIVNMVETANSLFFKTAKGFFQYEKGKRILKGYKYGVKNTAKLNSSLNHFLPVGDSADKIAFVYYPDMLKFAEKAIREKLSVLEENSKKGNDRFLSFASKVKAEDNPIIFIYTVN